MCYGSIRPLCNPPTLSHALRSHVWMLHRSMSTWGVSCAPSMRTTASLTNLSVFGTARTGKRWRCEKKGTGWLKSWEERVCQCVSTSSDSPNGFVLVRLHSLNQLQTSDQSLQLQFFLPSNHPSPSRALSILSLLITAQLPSFVVTPHYMQCISSSLSVIMTGAYNSFFRMFDRETGRGVTLEAWRESSKPRAVLRTRRVYTGGKRRRGDVGVDSLDFTKKILHMAWHPSENIIAIAATNNLYIFQDRVNPDMQTQWREAADASFTHWHR